ncbi:MAG: MBL fold metallo-hydrolase, partial [Gammaproteobacteria bacterium]|nr:MBL fold metallo-hydrolase [Gammaproteobacteria bacterium]
GLAAVVRTSNHLLVYDTGPRYSAHFDAGHAVVEPYLRSLGIGYIDTLVISHGDNDHAGGAESLLAAVPAGLILTGEPDQRWPTATTCRRGRRWQWDGVMFRILHPGKELSSQDNNNSCVLQVSVDGESILLPGDIESTVEEALVEIFGSELRSRIMVAPHHGSRTSSSEEFLAAVSPEHILFSVGYRNRFGLPAMQVLQRYRSHGAADHETASRGAITFKLGKENGELGLHYNRDERKRFWHR